MLEDEDIGLALATTIGSISTLQMEGWICPKCHLVISPTSVDHKCTKGGKRSRTVKKPNIIGFRP